MEELLEDFIAETREMLAAVAGELVAWEADPSDRARLNAVFRFIHTMKGNCGFLDQPRLARLSNAAEAVLADVRAGVRPADATLPPAILAVIDRIAVLVDAIDTASVPPPEADDARLIAALAPGAAAMASPSARLRPPDGAAGTVRLPTEDLDRLEHHMADLARAHRALVAVHTGDGRPAIDAGLDCLTAAIVGMRGAIDRTRRQPASILFARLARLARNLARRAHRRLSLETHGGEIVLDRNMIAAIRDSLTHILRNAIDHGIEPPADRRRLGKPPAGRLTVSAWHAGGAIHVAIADDGRGIDGDGLARRAVASGLLRADQAEALDHAGKLALCFTPGLSTVETVTASSGRGVGMDVVYANVARIGGRVELESEAGRGCRVTLRIPGAALPPPEPARGQDGTPKLRVATS